MEKRMIQGNLQSKGECLEGGCGKVQLPASKTMLPFMSHKQV